MTAGRGAARPGTGRAPGNGSGKARLGLDSTIHDNPGASPLPGAAWHGSSHNREEVTMKGRVVGVIVVIALVIGFGAGFGLRPILLPAGSGAASASVAQPTEAEAIAAVRRHKLFTGTSLANATLKLGDCSPSGVGPGVTCMTQLVMDTTKPNATPQNRPIGFARVNGQWEVAVW